MPRSDKGVTRPDSPPEGHVLLRDCHMPGRCGCMLRMSRQLRETLGVTATVLWAPDGSGQLLYVREEDLPAVLTWSLRDLYPYNCLKLRHH